MGGLVILRPDMPAVLHKALSDYNDAREQPRGQRAVLAEVVDIAREYCKQEGLLDE